MKIELSDDGRGTLVFELPHGVDRRMANEVYGPLLQRAVELSRTAIVAAGTHPGGGVPELRALNDELTLLIHRFAGIPPAPPNHDVVVTQS